MPFAPYGSPKTLLFGDVSDVEITRASPPAKQFPAGAPFLSFESTENCRILLLLAL